MSDLVSGLQEVATGKPDLNSIVNGASESLKLIEPWREASVDNEGLMSVVRAIQKNGLIYYDAIDMSIKTAEDGHAFSSDIIDLCDYLLKPSECTLNDILEYVKTIRDKANTAHIESKATMEMFRAVRTDLFKITQQIPVEVAKLRNTSKKGFVFKLSLFSKDTSKGASGFKWNPFSKKKNKMAELNKRELGCDVAIAELKKAAAALAELTNSVEKFVEWWALTETFLKTEAGRSNSLSPAKVQVLVVRGMQQGWRKIQEDYSVYKVQIIRLQDYYPPAAQRKLPPCE